MLVRNGRVSSVWREYGLALGLALLLAGVFLVPLFHFWPNVTKAIDPTFRAAQPLAYVPLNLVTIEPEAIPSATRGKLPYTYMYNLYIGWLPVVLALVGLTFGGRHALRARLFLSSGVFLMFLLSSAVPWHWLNGHLPLAANIRHTPLLAGLAVPAVIGLAAAGVDRLVTLPWPRFALPVFGRPGGRRLVLHSRFLLGVPLLWSLWTPAVLASNWLRTADMRPLYTAMLALHTPNLQWVAPPYGELRWTQVGLDLGLKLSPIVWVFTWRDVPMPRLEAIPDGGLPALLRLGPMAGRPMFEGSDLKEMFGSQVERVGALGEIPLYRYTGQHYAAVVTGMRVIPCQAAGSGGNLRIRCTTEQAGTLVVREHAWPGWAAWRGDTRLPLASGPWISVPAPTGTHEYVLRYRPWDVPAGFALTVLGAVLTLRLWIRSRVRTRP